MYSFLSLILTYQSKFTATHGNPLCKKVIVMVIGTNMMQQLLVFLSNAQIKIYQNPREPLCKNVIVSSLGTHMMQWLFFLSNISIQIYGYLSCNKLAIGTHMKQQYQFFLSNRLIEIYGNPWEPTGTHKNPSCKKAIVLAIGTHMKPIFAYSQY